MTASFRFVQFVTFFSPNAGRALPIAALVNDGATVTVITDGLENSNALTEEQRAVIQIAVADIKDTPDFDRLPTSVGPHITLGDRCEVPAMVQDPVAWVKNVINNTFTSVVQLVQLAALEKAALASYQRRKKRIMIGSIALNTVLVLAGNFLLPAGYGAYALGGYTVGFLFGSGAIALMARPPL